MDESGDLGFDFSKRKTSRYFVMAGLIVRNKRVIEKAIRTIYNELRPKYQIKWILHAAREESVTCSRLCRKISEKEYWVIVVYFEKIKIKSFFKKDKFGLYNSTAKELLALILEQSPRQEEKIEFIASSRETSKFLNEKFKNGLVSVINGQRDFSVEIKTPYEEKCLQAVDLISWSVFRSYEYSDDRYRNLIESIIIKEKELKL
ncbi:MAG: DUF3800 domain-containing protein [Patescibacteria group bacterium]